MRSVLRPLLLLACLLVQVAACSRPEVGGDFDLVFVSMEDGIEDLYVMNTQTGERRRVTVTDSVSGELRGSWAPAWSPDHERIAFASNRDDGGEADLYIVDRDGANLTRLTDREGFDYAPDFSPDGTRIVFVSDRDGAQDLYTMNADGSEVRRLTELAGPPGTLCCPDWHPDGTKIAFMATVGGFMATVWIVNADGSGARQLLTGAGLPRWSPDGVRLTYSGQRLQVFVADSSGSDPKQLTDMEGPAMYPVWSPDGHRIAFSYVPPGNSRPEQAELYVVDVDGSPPDRLTDNDFLDAHADWW